MWRDEQGRRELGVRVRMCARARVKERCHTHTNTLNAIIRRATSLPSTCPRPVRLPQMPAMLPACRRWFLGRPRASGAKKTAAAAAAPAPTAIPLATFSKTLPRASPLAPPALRARRRRRGMSAMDCAQTQRARASGAAVASANGDLHGARATTPRIACSLTCRWQGRVLSSTYHRWHSLRCWSANGLRLRQRRCTWRFVIDALVGEYAQR